MPEKVGTQYLHSWCAKGPGGYVYGVRESEVSKDENGELIYTPKLSILRNVSRPFWITKIEHRNHEYKKEFEDLDKCDRYQATDDELQRSIADALGLGFGYHSVRSLCRSPYLYGADISTETLIKQRYLEKSAGIPYNITVGALDIESDVVTEEINAITYIHGDQIYTAASKKYMRKETEDGRFVDAGMEDLQASIDTLVADDIKNHGFHANLYIADDEVTLIKWIFDRIHECKSDFISIWNMCFDIPRIIDRLKKHKVDPADVMCHPDVPADARICKWREDTSKVDHFTDRWDWFSLSGYSQFIDSMLLYSRLRKARGRESSYSLDAIAAKELGDSKIHFGKITDHQYMQKHRFCDYVAYNIKDVILLILLDRKCSDVANMVGLSGTTLLCDYSRQTRLVQNYAYAKAKRDGKVPASVSDNMYTEYDEAVSKDGGAVLPPGLAQIGTDIVKGSNRVTQVAIMVNDLDISSSYPSAVRSMNISKETQLSTILAINGYDNGTLEDFCTSAILPEVHAVDILHRLYNFPDYQEMERRFLAK